MKFYDIETEFTFGKFEGKTIREVIKIQPSYLNWCSINLEHFYISDEVIEEIKSILPTFSISEEGRSKLLEKYEQWYHQEYSHDNYVHDYYGNDHTYGEYAGSYAQDVAGFSDEDINTVFEGDPEAYWNID